jgi:phosphoesterase RecJ-like protein
VTIDLEPWLDIVPDDVVRSIAAARDVLIVTHENPDADTLGAALGVASIVERGPARVSLISTDPVPPLYAFIDGMDRFVADPEESRAYDLLVVCDCGSLDRIGAVRERHPELFERLPRVVIDHHASNDDTSAGAWIDPTAAATCEMVTLLAARMGISWQPAEQPLATALMAGIVMDTATFAHPNATPRTLAVSAALVEAGAPLAEISRRLYRSKPDGQLRLFGRVLDRLETTAGGRIVHSAMFDRDLDETGTIPPHSEGIIDLLSQSETADVSILFKEAGLGSTRVSVRTRQGGVDAAALTGRFGGGGHVRAAGATIDEPLPVARERFLDEARRLVAKLPDR